MAKIQLEIDTDDLIPAYDEDGDPIHGSLQDAVVARLASLIISQDTFVNDARNRVQKLVDETAEQKVAEAVREVLAGPIQRTTSWGEPQGEPTTVKEIIRGHVEAFMSGKATNGFGRNEHSLAHLIMEATRNYLSNDLKAAIDEVKATVTTEIRDKALKAAVNAISPSAR